MSFFAIDRKHQRWTTGAIDDSCRGNANDSAMPTFAFDDDAVRVFERGIFVQPLMDLLHHAQLFRLTVSVQRVELFRESLRLFLIARGEQVNDVASYVHATRSVDARRYTECNVSRCYRFST